MSILVCVLWIPLVVWLFRVCQSHIYIVLSHYELKGAQKIRIEKSERHSGLDQQSEISTIIEERKSVDVWDGTHTLGCCVGRDVSGNVGRREGFSKTRLEEQYRCTMPCAYCMNIGWESLVRFG